MPSFSFTPAHVFTMCLSPQEIVRVTDVACPQVALYSAIGNLCAGVQ